MRGILKTFVFAWKGLVYGFKSQRNIRIHSALSIITLLVANFLQINTIEWLVIFLCMGVVLGLEYLNSSIEELTDLVNPQYDIRAGRVKDLSAGAVLIGSIFAFLIALIIFIPKILNLFNSFYSIGKG